MAPTAATQMPDAYLTKMVEVISASAMQASQEMDEIAEVSVDHFTLIGALC